jgi:hypothetical protein
VPKFGRFAKFLNSPFGIWLLSSIVIAAFVSYVSEEERRTGQKKSINPFEFLYGRNRRHT